MADLLFFKAIRCVLLNRYRRHDVQPDEPHLDWYYYDNIGR